MSAPKPIDFIEGLCITTPFDRESLIICAAMTAGQLTAAQLKGFVEACARLGQHPVTLLTELEKAGVKRK